MVLSLLSFFNLFSSSFSSASSHPSSSSSFSCTSSFSLSPSRHLLVFLFSLTLSQASSLRFPPCFVCMQPIITAQPFHCVCVCEKSCSFWRHFTRLSYIYFSLSLSLTAVHISLIFQNVFHTYRFISNNFGATTTQWFQRF